MFPMNRKATAARGAGISCRGKRVRREYADSYQAREA